MQEWRTVNKSDHIRKLKAIFYDNQSRSNFHSIAILPVSLKSKIDFQRPTRSFKKFQFIILLWWTNCKVFSWSRDSKLSSRLMYLEIWQDHCFYYWLFCTWKRVHISFQIFFVVIRFTVLVVQYVLFNMSKFGARNDFFHPFFSCSSKDASL